jgi:hypothetical protein
MLLLIRKIGARPSGNGTLCHPASRSIEARKGESQRAAKGYRHNCKWLEKFSRLISSERQRSIQHALDLTARLGRDRGTELQDEVQDVEKLQ